MIGAGFTCDDFTAAQIAHALRWMRDRYEAGSTVNARQWRTLTAWRAVLRNGLRLGYALKGFGANGSTGNTRGREPADVVAQRLIDKLEAQTQQDAFEGAREVNP